MKWMQNTARWRFNRLWYTCRNLRGITIWALWSNGNWCNLEGRFWYRKLCLTSELSTDEKCNLKIEKTDFRQEIEKKKHDNLVKNRKENISTFYSTKWVRSMIFIEWIKWTLSSDLTYFTLVSVIHENNEICYKKVTLKVSIVQHNYRLVQKWQIWPLDGAFRVVNDKKKYDLKILYVYRTILK